MGDSSEFRNTEAKVLGFVQRSLVSLKTLFRSFVSALENYIRGKTKNLPKIPPQSRRAIADSILERVSQQNFLNQFAGESGIPIDHVEGTFRGYLHEIASDLNYLTMPFWDFLLTWVFETVYEGLEVDLASLEKVRPLVGRHPVIFVSSHRSHMDYLLLSYVFYHSRLPVPHICAGSNLSFWPLGPFFRKSGAFFIRRSYEGNKLYAAAVQAYIEELVRDKMTMEFFIEGTRSRTGKLLPPRLGILSSVVQSYLSGAAEDILLIPTSLTYESIIEEKGYVDERSGASKKEEGFWDLFRLRKYLKKKKGKVYIRFGEPLSLRGFLEGLPPGEDLSKKDKVRQLAYEITYGINKSTVVTPASLAATALLTHQGQALSDRLLREKVDRYLDYLRSKDCRLSETFQKNRVNALSEALKNYERDHLIECYDDEGSPLYRIRENRQALLDYYKNTSIHFFVSMGVLATLLRASPSELVSLKKIEEDYVFLQDLFQYEFTFSRRQGLMSHLEKLLGYLEGKKMIRVEDSTVRLLPEAKSALSLFSAPVQGFFEGYYVLWRTLPLLGKRRWELREILSYLQERGKILYLKEEISRPESINKFTFHNALFIFRDLGVLREEKEGWGKKRKTFYAVEGDGQEIGKKLAEFLGK